MCSRLALGTVLLAVFSGCATEATIATPPTAVIALSSGTLDFSAAQGGANPAGQSITISNSAAGPLSGLAIGPIEYGPGAAAWLAGPSLNATGGAATLEVHAITGSLTPGTYTATISIGATGASNGPLRLTVRLSVGIGPDGGTIASADGRIALAVPAGALTDTANIRIATSADPPPSAAPEGVKALLGSWALSPSGLVLNAPVKLTISYANVLGQVPSSDSIGVLHWDSAGSFIDAVSASDDRTSKSLTFSISHFSNVSLAHTGGTFSLLQVKWATSTIRTSVAVPYSQAVFDDWQFATSGIEFVPASASAANIVIHDRADHFFCDSPGRAALLLDQFISTCLPSLTRALTAADVVHIFSPYPGSPPAATISTLQHAIGHAIGIGHPWRLPPAAAGSPLTNPPAWPVMQAQLLPLSGPQFSRTGLHPLDVDAIQAKYGPVLAPSISGVAPTSLLTSPAPQILTLAGLRFVPGTSITVTPPGQSPTLIGASQVTFVSRQSLRFSVALGIPGNWNLLATSPSGQKSNVLAMPVAAAPAALGAIAGSVTSPQIGALAAVTVSAAGISTTTDSSGAYRLDGVSAGTVTLSLSHLPGSCTNPGSRQATVQSNAVIALSFSVPCARPTGTVVGTVISPPTGPLGGISVDGAGRSAVTNAAGAYTLSNVPTGAVSISLGNLPSGCTNPGPRPTNVAANLTTVVDFRLTCQLTTGTVSGNITSPQTGGISGAYMYMASGFGVSVVSNGGRFSITNVQPGPVLVAAARFSIGAGCIPPLAQSAVVIANATTTVDFSVICGGPALPPPRVTSPEPNTIVAQNDPTTGTAYNASYGYGFHADLGWTSVAGSPLYEFRGFALSQGVRARNAFCTSTVDAVVARCIEANGFADQGSPIEFEVRGYDAGGFAGQWSTPLSLTLGRCTLNDGTPCGTVHIKVVVSTTGQNIPGGAYTAGLDPGTAYASSQPLPIDGSAAFALLTPPIPAGSSNFQDYPHVVTLSGVPANCTVNGGLATGVSWYGLLGTATFQVACR